MPTDGLLGAIEHDLKEELRMLMRDPMENVSMPELELKPGEVQHFTNNDSDTLEMLHAHRMVADQRKKVDAARQDYAANARQLRVAVSCRSGSRRWQHSTADIARAGG